MNVFSIEQQRQMRMTDPFDARNITDEFKNMPNDMVKSILDLRTTDLVICCSNLIKDFNFGSVIRSANGFGAKEIVFTGRRQYDRRGAVGMQHYCNIKYIEDYIEAFSYYRSIGYTIVAAEYDPVRMQYNIETYNWNPKTVMVFGEEGRGLESEILDQVDDIVYIPMQGCVRSFNVASTANTFMYDYNRKMSQ